MASRQVWLKCLAVVLSGGGDVQEAPCPDCGQKQLELRYIVEPDTRMGFALFWCNANLHGITVSRVQAPEGVPMRVMGAPEALEGVPEFTRHE